MMECRFVWIFFVTFLHFTYYGASGESVSRRFKRHAFVEIRGKFNQFSRNASEIYDNEYKEIETDETGKLDSKKPETAIGNRQLSRKKEVKLEHKKPGKKNEIRNLDDENVYNKRQGDNVNGTETQKNEKKDDEKLKSRIQKLKQLKDENKTTTKECNENLNAHNDGLGREIRIACKKQKRKIWKQRKQHNLNGTKQTHEERREKQYSGTRHSTIQNTNTLHTNPSTIPPTQCTKRNGNNYRNHVYSCMMNAMLEDKIKEKWKSLITSLVITETDNIPFKTVTFTPSVFTLEQVFFYLRYFTILYNDGNAVMFSLPVDGKRFDLLLKNEGGILSAEHIYERVKRPGGMEIEGGDDMVEENIFDVKPAVTPNTKGMINEVFKLIIELLKSTLDTKGILKKLKDTFPEINDIIIDNVFKEMIEITAACFLKDNIWYQEEWLNFLKKTIHDNIKIFEEGIKNDATTKVKYELTANMLKTADEAKQNWENLLKSNDFTVTTDSKSGQVTVQFSKYSNIKLKCALKLLQYILGFYFHPDSKKPQQKKHVAIKIPIGKLNAVFKLGPGRGNAAYQILVNTKKADYPGTASRGRGASKYEDFVDKLLNSFGNQPKLANALLNALHLSLNNQLQPDFNKLLEVKKNGIRNDKETAEIYRATVDFLAITMIAEAAQPTDDFKSRFLKELSELINTNRRFPVGDKMPKLAKEGRTPSVDQRTIQLLQEMRDSGENIKNVFTSKKFPARGKEGTQMARNDAQKNGEESIPAYAVHFLGKKNTICY